MKKPKKVVFVVKRYAVREAEKWRYAVRKAKIGRYAVRQGGGGCHSHKFDRYLSQLHKTMESQLNVLDDILREYPQEIRPSVSHELKRITYEWVENRDGGGSFHISVKNYKTLLLDIIDDGFTLTWSPRSRDQGWLKHPSFTLRVFISFNLTLIIMFNHNDVKVCFSLLYQMKLPSWFCTSYR